MKTRKHIHEPHHLGEAAADRASGFVGSWLFIGLMTLLLVGWVLWNVLPVLPHFDPPQFALLNLCLSFIAGYTGPIVLLSQNRQADKDRRRDDLEAQEVAQLFSSHDLLVSINRQQLEILQLLREHQTTQPGDVSERLLFRIDKLGEEVLTNSQIGLKLLESQEKKPVRKKVSERQREQEV